MGGQQLSPLCLRHLTKTFHADLMVDDLHAHEIANFSHFCSADVQRMYPCARTCCEGKVYVDVAPVAPAGPGRTSARTDLLVLVLSMASKIGWGRIAAIRETWGKVRVGGPDDGLLEAGLPSFAVRVRYAFAGARPADVPERADELWLPGPNGLRYIAMKVLAMLNWAAVVHSQLQFKHVMKVDDDTFLCVPMLGKFLRVHSQTPLYAGNPSGGNNVYLSKKFYYLYDGNYMNVFHPGWVGHDGSDIISAVSVRFHVAGFPCFLLHWQPCARCGACVAKPAHLPASCWIFSACVTSNTNCCVLCGWAHTLLFAEVPPLQRGWTWVHFVDGFTTLLAARRADERGWLQCEQDDGGRRCGHRPSLARLRGAAVCIPVPGPREHGHYDGRLASA